MKKTEKILKTADALKAYSHAKVKNEQDEMLFSDAVRYLCEYAKNLSFAEEEKKLSKVNTKWTEKEDEKLKKEYEKGWKTARIAKSHSRSISGIVSRLVKLGLVADDGENGKKRWTEEEDALLLKEANALKTLERMADTHGRSLSGILSRLEKLGYDIDSRQ